MSRAEQNMTVQGIGAAEWKQLIAGLEAVDLSALASDHAATMRGELRRIRHNVDLFLRLIADLTCDGQFHPDHRLREVLASLRRECLLLRRLTLAAETLSWMPRLQGIFTAQTEKTTFHYYRFSSFAHELYLLKAPSLADSLQFAL